MKLDPFWRVIRMSGATPTATRCADEQFLLWIRLFVLRSKSSRIPKELGLTYLFIAHGVY